MPLQKARWQQQDISGRDYKSQQRTGQSQPYRWVLFLNGIFKFRGRRFTDQPYFDMTASISV